jgi:uncharacterized membrane protein YphA (DoxX/SURF4 family)
VNLIAIAIHVITWSSSSVWMTLFVCFLFMVHVDSECICICDYDTYHMVYFIYVFVLLYKVVVGAPRLDSKSTRARDFFRAGRRVRTG